MKFSFIRKKSLHDRNIQNIKNFLKLTTKAFGLKIFSRDGSQGNRIGGKYGGFVDLKVAMSEKLNDFD